jgi:diguanylate cyclase (GGDEF)-like protein/PAS domain S-box-containing protein
LEEIVLEQSGSRNFDFLAGGGEMGALMRAYDWENSSLGAPESWPPVLKTVLRLLLTTNHPMFIFWGDELIQFYNDAYRQTLGPERHPCALGGRGRECWDEIWDVIGPQISYVMEGKGATWHEHQPIIITRHGRREVIWWTYGYSPIEDETGVRGVLVICNDITKEHLTLEELRTSDERLKAALELSGTGVWEWNPRTNDVILSPAWKHMLGYDDDEVENRFESWQSRIHPEDVAKALSAVRVYAEGKTGIFEHEYRMRCKDGQWKWIRSRGATIERDSDGKPLKVIGSNSDISDKRRSEEQIWHQANFDDLTSLPNRRLFKVRLDWEVKKADRWNYSVNLLFIDLDRFKEVNDLLGHDVGDTILKDAARRISACVRASDTVARLGGDEFTVILADLAEGPHVELIAQAILDALAASFKTGNDVIYLSASIGITIYKADAETPEEMIQNADQAMYAAKAAGRNQFCFFTRSMQEGSHHRLRLIADLRNALQEKQLKVFFQPVSDLVTGRIFKAEALLRWFHPELGQVEPTQFIPLAEECGLINEIGDWVFKEAVSWSDRWGAQFGPPFPIGVNKSPVQFLSRGKDTDWINYLHAKGLGGESIVVEITEGVLLQASSNVVDKLLEYRDAGIQVALDDFGTGYSSMAYLQKFHIDYLKIDQSFVRNMASNPADRAIVRSIIAMAHELGLKVIAEGIETHEQLDLLVRAKCDFGQGFLFSQAIPPEQMEALLQENEKRYLLLAQ